MAGVGPIALVAAAHAELRPTLRALGLSRQEGWFVGQVEDRRVVATISGVGAAAAIRALELIVAVHRPRRVVHLGFAGGLDPDLQCGQTLRFNVVMNTEHAALCLCVHGPPVVDDDPKAAERLILLSVDDLVFSVRQKQQLAQRWPAHAVDMETFAVADYARVHGICLTALRAICDTATENLPMPAASWIRPDGRAHGWAIGRYLAVHPHHLPWLLMLGRAAGRAAGSLAAAVRQEILDAGGDR